MSMRHIIDRAAIDAAKPDVTIINTSRGALIDTKALIAGLKSHKIGSVALDVYEQEADLFFKDLSNEIIDDDVFQRLLTFPNVLVTGHQAFLTEEALAAIAEATLQSIADAFADKPLSLRIGAEFAAPVAAS
jgi:D-lactate dehydrogenase